MALAIHLQRNLKAKEHPLSPNKYHYSQIPKEVAHSFSRKDTKHSYHTHFHFVH